MFQIAMLSVVMYFIGGLLISLCAATIFVLAFETPFTRVEKILVRQNLESICWDRAYALNILGGTIVGSANIQVITINSICVFFEICEYLNGYLIA